MTKPVIVAVDDDPQVLRAVERDLVRHFGEDYRVVSAPSGADALGVVERLKLRNDDIAIFLTDQRMPGMSGVEFLTRARELYERAKRVLLTAYADTDAAIDAINRAGLDYYIMKPWDPPEERLYPVLDDLLEDWLATFRPTFEGIRVVGDRWSRRAHDLREFLARNLVPYEFLDVATGEEPYRLLELAGVDTHDMPVVLFPDGSHLVRPSPVQLAERIGLSTHAERPSYDLVIVGSGPAGLAAAVYGASEGLRSLLVERQAPGGQAGQSSRIENYLGFPAGLSGSDLARRAVTQARRFGAELLVPQEAVGLEREGPYHTILLRDGSKVSCQALVVATGVSYRTLPVEGAEELTGTGIYYGASHIEALTHQDQHVFVVGGGNSAGQSALFLSRYAKRVTLLVRRDSLSETMSRYLIDQLEATDGVDVRCGTQVVAVHAENGRLAGLTLESRSDGAHEDVEAGALFAFIGQAPRTDWIEGVVARDERGFILSGLDLGGRPEGWTLERDPFPLETSVPGIFVAGDVRHSSIKRVASATGEGAMAVRFVHEHLASL